jgi:hypothetical protein
MEGLMGLVQKLDDWGKPAWIALMVAGFVLFWPIGLAILFYMKGSGRMGCWKHGRAGQWHMPDGMSPKDRYKAWKRGWGRYPSSGNVAFDEYREETLRRLEDDQREFREFLDKLRAAKDKAEFDQFMADRRSRPSEPPPAPPAPPQA